MRKISELCDPLNSTLSLTEDGKPWKYNQHISRENISDGVCIIYTKTSFEKDEAKHTKFMISREVNCEIQIN